MPDVAVIVPTYQRAEKLPALVAALEAQSLPPDAFEVVICDDSSTDETQAVLTDLVGRSLLQMRVLRTARNSGPATARNLAWRSTRASWLAFVDDDNIPTPQWLEAGVAALQTPGVGVVQGRTRPDPRTPIRAWSSTQNIADFSKRFEACNIFYRRDVLEAVGGFDESIHFFGEDSAAGWRAQQLGVRARFARAALAHHEVRQRGFRWWVRWALLHRNWPMLVRRFPHVRRELLWGRLFLDPHHLALLLAVGGIVMAATFWPPALLLATPTVARYIPTSLHPKRLANGVIWLGYDALVLVALILGSIRSRTLML